MKITVFNPVLTGTNGATTTTHSIAFQHDVSDQIPDPNGEPMVAISALANIVMERAAYQLTFGSDMPGFFFLTKAELVGAACPDTQSSGLDFKDFIQSLRLLGEAHNVTNGVLYDFLTDDRNPDQKMVLLVAQTREMNANIIFPVQFKPDGTFSNFGPPRPVKPFPWLKHIVPAEDTNATAQEAALAALEGRHVTLAF